MTASHFAILESQEENRRRLLLTGELDLASIPLLEDRLSRLAGAQVAVCLDISRLEFIDSTGLRRDPGNERRER